MAASCVSFFTGNVFAVGNMVLSSAKAYAAQKILSERRERAESSYREAQGEQDVMRSRYQRFTQQARDHLEYERVRLSRLQEEVKSDEAMLKEELKSALWRLERQDIANCNALQERLLQSSWNLLRKYSLHDEYRLTQNSLNNFYRAVQQEDPARRSRMLRNLEDEFRAYPPYWFNRARTAQEAGNLNEARKYYAEFRKIWRPVLRRDPYMLEAAKFSDFGYEEKVSGMLFAQMEKGALDSDEAQETVHRMKLDDLVTSMNIADGNSAVAMALYFEGNIDALEKMAVSSDNPVVFHALRLMEQMKGNAGNYARVMEYLRRHDSLKDRISETYSEIVPLVKKYVDEGRENAKIFMADMLLYGLGIEQDRQKAEAMFTELAENGNIYAQFMMIQSRFATVAPAPKKEPALTPQQAEALFQEGEKYYRKAIYKKAAECYLQATEAGHAEAQYTLGVYYRNGLGVSQDLQKARKWFKRRLREATWHVINSMT